MTTRPQSNFKAKVGSLPPICPRPGPKKRGNLKFYILVGGALALDGKLFSSGAPHTALQMQDPLPCLTF